MHVNALHCELPFDRPSHFIKHFLGDFAKLRKVTISFVMSARLSVRQYVRMEQLCFYWMDFHEIWYLGVFRKSV